MTLDIGDGDGEAIEAAAQAIDAAHDPVAALVVPVAVFQDVLPPSDLPVQVWDDVLRVNLTGTYLCARAFGTRMAQ